MCSYTHMLFYKFLQNFQSGLNAYLLTARDTRDEARFPSTGRPTSPSRLISCQKSKWIFTFCHVFLTLCAFIERFFQSTEVLTMAEAKRGAVETSPAKMEKIVDGDNDSTTAEEREAFDIDAADDDGGDEIGVVSPAALPRDTDVEDAEGRDLLFVV